MTDNATAEAVTGLCLFLTSLWSMVFWNSEVLAGLCLFLVAVLAVSRTWSKSQ